MKKNKDQQDIDSIDWDDITTPKDKEFKHRINKISHFSKKIGTSGDTIQKAWKKHCTGIVEKSASIFRKYEHIETSRLHGHIFCCLLGISHTIIDNSYGKNSSYYNAWTKDLDIANLK